MNSIIYKKAMKEVTEYLKGIREEDLNKIPDDFLKFLNDNEDKDYQCDFDYTKPIKEINLTNEAKGIILYIAYNYWCETENDKKEFSKRLDENEKKFEEQLSFEFNKTANTNQNEKNDDEEMLSIVNIEIDETKNKVSIFTKILNFIKKLKKKS